MMPKVGMKPIRQEQLIKATLAVVRDHGLSNATVAKISEAAGVSAGIISHYFDGKNGLIIACMKHLLAEIYHNQRDHQREANSPRDHIVAIIQANFSPSQIEPAAVVTWLSFWAEAMHHPELARLQHINRRRLQSNLAYWFGQLLPREAAKREAQVLSALIDGLWLRGAFDAEGIDPELAKQLCYQQLDRAIADVSLT